MSTTSLSRFTINLKKKKKSTINHKRQIFKNKPTFFEQNRCSKINACIDANYRYIYQVIGNIYNIITKSACQRFMPAFKKTLFSGSTCPVFTHLANNIGFT